jgi:hypothetical protein|nr:MAG TPA: hypothetical protein [Caudoviricetes sp.]
MLTEEKYLDILDKFEFLYGYNLKATASRETAEEVKEKILNNLIRDLGYFRELVYAYFDNNSPSFKFFKLHSDSTLKSKKKDELIADIHALYNNWKQTDSFYYNAVKFNQALSEELKEVNKQKAILLDDVHDYRYENHCMKMTIRNLCVHFGVENIEELQKIYLKEK